MVTAPDGWGMAWEEKHGEEAGRGSIQSVDICVLQDCLFGSCVQLKGRAPIILSSYTPALVNRLCFWCLALCGSCYDSAVFMAFTEVIPSDALSQVCVQM